MRHLTTLSAIAVLLLGFAFTAAAGDKATSSVESAKAVKMVENEKTELKNQTHCPVMGGKIDSTAYTDIQGQRVYHCCPMCTEKLTADPDKYFKKAAEEGILFENIQTNCPVSGKELKAKTVSVDYEGRRVYFCCEMCPPKFAKDPQTYLEKMTPNAETMKMEEGMKGHEGNDQEADMHEGHNH